MPPNNFIFCLPLCLLPLIFPCLRVFSNVSVFLIRWPKYWRFSFSIGPSNEYSGLISFIMDWLNLLAVQGTLKSLVQHHSLKASILWYSAFFMIQFSHPITTYVKTIALTIQTFAGKVMSLVFSMLSRFFIAFLPSTKCLFFFFSSKLQSLSTVILEPRGKSVTAFIVSPCIFHEIMERVAVIFIFWSVRTSSRPSPRK